MMTRNVWESTFRRQLKAQLDIVPEQINFCWKQYFSQRYTPEQAIAHLTQTHELYPSLGILPVTQNDSLASL